MRSAKNNNSHRSVLKRQYLHGGAVAIVIAVVAVLQYVSVTTRIMTAFVGYSAFSSFHIQLDIYTKENAIRGITPIVDDDGESWKNNRHRIVHYQRQRCRWHCKYCNPVRKYSAVCPPALCRKLVFFEVRPVYFGYKQFRWQTAPQWGWLSRTSSLCRRVQILEHKRKKGIAIKVTIVKRRLRCRFWSPISTRWVTN